MKIFVTGATGFIGSALVQELLGAGHQVLGLARSDESARSLAQAGAEAHRGSLDDLDSLRHGAQACDGVAHLGFVHDFSKYLESIEKDRRALGAMIGALEGSGKPLAVAFGALGLGKDGVLTENDEPRSGPDANPRTATEALVRDAAGCGVRASVVRLSPTVHGKGDRGFVPMLIDLARRKGFAAYVGDGTNHWPAVHRLDAARLFRLALEKAEPGTRLHAVAEEGIPMRVIAETIGEGLGVPARSIPSEEAAAHFDWMAKFTAVDAPTSNEITRRVLSWEPREIGLLADMRENGYLDANNLD